jgi:NADPH:quinone reductase-like Zn-dependent oxidoreductase
LVAPLLANGTYKPLIDRRYALDDIREAFTYVDSGQKIGNVLLTLA